MARSGNRGTRIRREHVALALAAVALFVTLGGPAYAASLINGKTIKPKSITAKQLAKGAVSTAALSSSVRKSLKGTAGGTGPAGAAGAIGPAGDTGATGSPTVYDVYDSAGRRIGRDAGLLVSYQLVLNDAGALLAYSFDTATSLPAPLGAGTLFYKQAGCGGQPYLVMGITAQATVFQEPTPAVGSTIWIEDQAPPETFTYQSTRTNNTCTNGSGAATSVVPARTAGTVPTVQKPLVLKAVG